MKLTLTLVVALSCLLFVHLAMAAESLPIKHGLYIEESESCPTPQKNCETCWPTFEGGLSYGGKRGTDGFYDHGNVYSCEFVSIKKKGSDYNITQQCFTGMGHHDMGKEKFTLTIIDETSFSLTQAKQKTVYKYCTDKID